ncbi:MAG: phosphatase PAP2 family protein [Phycisphaerae bacterium]|nr:phosphatase PAP2 family protein [Phycisphaerae bacterium]
MAFSGPDGASGFDAPSACVGGKDGGSQRQRDSKPPPEPKKRHAYPWKQHLLLLLPVLAGIVFFHVWLSSHIHEHKAHYATVTSALLFVTSYGVYVFYATYAVLLIDAIRTRDAQRLRLVLRVIIVQLVVGLLVVHALKNTFGYPRPGVEGVRPAHFKSPQTPAPEGYRTVLNVLCLPRSPHQSFPSGHTTDILISTLPLALFYWRRYWPVAVLCGTVATLVVFSRLWLCNHHVVDTLGGVVLASIGVYFIIRNLGPAEPRPGRRERDSGLA